MWLFSLSFTHYLWWVHLKWNDQLFDLPSTKRTSRHKHLSKHLLQGTLSSHNRIPRAQKKSCAVIPGFLFQIKEIQTHFDLVFCGKTLSLILLVLSDTSKEHASKQVSPLVVGVRLAQMSPVNTHLSSDASAQSITYYSTHTHGYMRCQGEYGLIDRHSALKK